MATFCLGCGEDLSTRTGDRRILTQFSAVSILWKAIAQTKLSQLGKVVDFQAELHSPRFMCRRCFGGYERCQRLQDSLLENIIYAVANMTSVRDQSPTVQTITSAIAEMSTPSRCANKSPADQRFEEQRGMKRRREAERDSTTETPRAKKALFGRSPSGQQSPSVVVCTCIKHF